MSLVRHVVAAGGRPARETFSLCSGVNKRHVVDDSRNTGHTAAVTQVVLVPKALVAARSGAYVKTMKVVQVLRGFAVLFSCAAALGFAQQSPAPNFRSDANVVLINATVLDRHDRPVRGLSKSLFRIYENKTEQAVTSFGEEDLPLSLAILFDNSGSMEGKLAGAREALAALLRNSNREDEFALITFSDRPQVAVPWTSNPAEVQNNVLSNRSRGRTSLLDAIRLGLAQMQQSRNPRRALLILSDGGDNYSGTTERQLTSRLEEAGVQLYAVDMSVAPVLRERSPEEVEGPDLLARLCDHAGGRYYRVETRRELAATANQIGNELRSQYVLGFMAPNATEDGRFHRVRLQVVRQEGMPKLSVYWRRGYRAPSD